MHRAGGSRECRALGTMGRGGPWGFDAESLVPGEQAGTSEGWVCPPPQAPPPAPGGEWRSLEQVCGWETSLEFRSSNPSASAPSLQGRARPFVLPITRGGGGGGRRTGLPRGLCRMPEKPPHPQLTFVAS